MEPVLVTATKCDGTQATGCTMARSGKVPLRCGGTAALLSEADPLHPFLRQRITIFNPNNSEFTCMEHFDVAVRTKGRSVLLSVGKRVRHCMLPQPCSELIFVPSHSYGPMQRLLLCVPDGNPADFKRLLDLVTKPAPSAFAGGIRFPRVSPTYSLLSCGDVPAARHASPPFLLTHRRPALRACNARTPTCCSREQPQHKRHSQRPLVRPPRLFSRPRRNRPCPFSPPLPRLWRRMWRRGRGFTSPPATPPLQRPRGSSCSCCSSHRPRRRAGRPGLATATRTRLPSLLGAGPPPPPRRAAPARKPPPPPLPPLSRAGGPRLALARCRRRRMRGSRWRPLSHPGLIPASLR